MTDAHDSPSTPARERASASRSPQLHDAVDAPPVAAVREQPQLAELRAVAHERLLEIQALSQHLTQLAARHAEVNALLISAHEQLLERDRKLQSLIPVEQELEEERATAAALRHERNLLAGRLEGIERSRAWHAVLVLRRLKRLLEGT